MIFKSGYFCNYFYWLFLLGAQFINEARMNTGKYLEKLTRAFILVKLVCHPYLSCVVWPPLHIIRITYFSFVSADLFLFQMSQCPPNESLNTEFYPEKNSGEKIRPCMACQETRAARESCIKEQVKEFFLFDL